MSTKKKPHRQHHYVPRFYLNGFIDPNHDPMIWVYRKGDEKIFSVPSQGIGFENHYYSFTTADGEKDSETVENMFGSIEGPASAVFKKLKNLEVPNEEDRRIFTTFLALMMVRVPSFRQNTEETASQLFTMLGKMRVSNIDTLKRDLEQYERETGETVGVSAEELQKTVLEDKVRVVAGPEMSLKMIGIAENLETILAGMKWVYLRATEQVKFVSSDDPLTYNDPTHKPGSYFGVGLANENVEVTFPISRDLACLGSWKSKVKSSFLQATPELVKETNRRTVRAAVREVYSSQKSKALSRLVQKYKDSAPKVQISGMF